MCRIKAGRSSKGLQCLGDFTTGAKCRRARDGSKLPVVLNKKCVHCKEQRCRAHCKCKRNKARFATGRGAPRGSSDAPRSEVVVSSVASPVRLPGPAGRALGESCSLMPVDDYYSSCCKAISNSSEVELATYMYDHPALQKVLLQRLRGRAHFSLRFYIDAEMFRGTVPHAQKCRVRQLLAAGATVLLCKGYGPQGSFHCKGIVVDRKYLYIGSANATFKSQSNEEFCFRITGAPVTQILERLSLHVKKGKLWDGS